MLAGDFEWTNTKTVPGPGNLFAPLVQERGSSADGVSVDKRLKKRNGVTYDERMVTMSRMPRFYETSDAQYFFEELSTRVWKYGTPGVREKLGKWDWTACNVYMQMWIVMNTLENAFGWDNTNSLLNLLPATREPKVPVSTIITDAYSSIRMSELALDIVTEHIKDALDLPVLSKDVWIKRFTADVPKVEAQLEMLRYTFQTKKEAEGGLLTLDQTIEKIIALNQQTENEWAYHGTYWCLAKDELWVVFSITEDIINGGRMHLVLHSWVRSLVGAVGRDASGKRGEPLGVVMMSFMLAIATALLPENKRRAIQSIFAQILPYTMDVVDSAKIDAYPTTDQQRATVACLEPHEIIMDRNPNFRALWTERSPEAPSFRRVNQCQGCGAEQKKKFCGDICENLYNCYEK